MRIYRFYRWIKDADGVWHEPTRPVVTHMLSHPSVDGEFPVRQQIKRGEIAFTQAGLDAKLGGDMAEVDDPGRPWYVQLWRMVFPLRMIEGAAGRSDIEILETTNG